MADNKINSNHQPQPGAIITPAPSDHFSSPHGHQRPIPLFHPAPILPSPSPRGIDAWDPDGPFSLDHMLPGCEPLAENDLTFLLEGTQTKTTVHNLAQPNFISSSSPSQISTTQYCSGTSAAAPAPHKTCGQLLESAVTVGSGRLQISQRQSKGKVLTSCHSIRKKRKKLRDASILKRPSCLDVKQVNEEEMKRLRRVKNRESVEKCRTKQKLRMEALQVEQNCLMREIGVLNEIMLKLEDCLRLTLDESATLGIRVDGPLWKRAEALVDSLQDVKN